VLKINEESKPVLENLISQSKCRHLFSQPRHPDRKLEPWVLESEMGRLREKLAHDKIKLDADAGLHTLRHTFLTEAGEHTDAFTLQYIAGRDTIKTTMRYVHPGAESVSRAFGADQSEKEASGAGVADRKRSHEAVEELRERYVANSVYKSAYTENCGCLKLYL
jgi:integrase